MVNLKRIGAGLLVLAVTLAVTVPGGSAQDVATITPIASPAVPSVTCAFRPASDDVVFDVVPGKNGLFFRRDTDFEEFFELTPETQRNFRQLAEALRIRGSELVFVPLPTRGLVQHEFLDDTNSDQALYDYAFARREFANYVEQVEAAGVVVVDLLAEIETENVSDEFYFLRDHHWTTQGAHLAAKAVARSLAAVPKVAALSTFSYETTRTGTVARKSPMGFEIQRRCGGELPAEIDLAFATNRAAATADDLFGANSQTAPVALVGTSFSGGDFHFSGFIAQETSLEIANFAIDGAEFIGSLASLVFDRTFVEAPPPVIIWEAPSYYNINQEMFSAINQMLPAIYGPCAPEDTQADSGAIRLAGETNVLSLAPEAGIAGAQYYIYLDGPDLGDAPVSINLRFADDDHSTTALGDFSNFVRDGQYYLQLNAEITAPLVSVSVETAAAADVTVKLCSVPALFSSIDRL